MIFIGSQLSSTPAARPSRRGHDVEGVKAPRCASPGVRYDAQHESSCRQGAMAGLVAFIIMLIMAPAQIMKRMGAGPFVWRARQPLW